MAENKQEGPISYHLRIITPQRTVFDEGARAMVAQSTGGVVEILPRHEPLLTPMAIHLLTVSPWDRRKYGSSDLTFAVNGGFLETDGATANLYATSAETADEIDVERAKEALHRARERLAKVTRHEGEEMPVDLDRAKLALLRALNRLQLRGDAVPQE